MLRLLVVPGTTPQKWVGTWRDRTGTPLELVHATTGDQLALVRSGAADMGLVRLDERPADLHAISLYTESTVVVVPVDHLLTAADELTLADLADEVVLAPTDDPLTWATRPGAPGAGPAPDVAGAVELVAAGVGVVVLPQSLARLHHRRDLTYRPLTDAPTSTVHLVWSPDRADERTEVFIGIVRGRTAHSSRGADPQEAKEQRDKPQKQRPAPRHRTARTPSTKQPPRGRRRR